MAEKKLEKPAKKEKRPGIFHRIGGFFVDCKSELKKVVWLSRAETLKKTAVVVVMMLITGAAIGVTDFLLTQLILLLGRLV